MLVVVDLMRSQQPKPSILNHFVCVWKVKKCLRPLCTLKANTFILYYCYHSNAHTHTRSVSRGTNQKRIASAKSVFSHLFVYVYRIQLSAFDTVGKEKTVAQSTKKKESALLWFFSLCYFAAQVTFENRFSLQYHFGVTILLWVC